MNTLWQEEPEPPPSSPNEWAILYNGLTLCPEVLDDRTNKWVRTVDAKSDPTFWKTQSLAEADERLAMLRAKYHGRERLFKIINTKEL